MSKLGFGMMRLPVMEDEDPQSINQKLVNQMADHFLAKGFTYFDTAYPYHQGMSEVAARRALVERYPRETFTLADKMPTFFVTCPDDYPRLFNEQLERCGVDYFDYYLLHALGAGLYASTVEHGGFEFMRKVQAEGKAKRIGLSFHDKADLLDRILSDHPEMEFVQLQINYLDWENASIQSRECYEVALKHDKPVIVMEPIKGGCLANVPTEAEQLLRDCHPNWSTASWAIRFAASLDNVSMVLSGMSNLEQVLDNADYMQDMVRLGDTEQSVLQQATEIIRASVAIPCTACQYCVDGCPQNIPIPKFFALYNDQHQFGLTMSHAIYYGNLVRELGKASDCIGCRQCEEHCPQHIAIVEQLGEVARIFDA